MVTPSISMFAMGSKCESTLMPQPARVSSPRPFFTVMSPGAKSNCFALLPSMTPVP